MKFINLFAYVTVIFLLASCETPELVKPIAPARALDSIEVEFFADRDLQQQGYCLASKSDTIAYAGVNESVSFPNAHLNVCRELGATFWLRTGSHYTLQVLTSRAVYFFPFQITGSGAIVAPRPTGNETLVWIIENDCKKSVVLGILQ